MERLRGKVALVTGGARGLGEATVRLFVEQGAKVVFGDVLEEEGQALAKALGPSASFLRMDVRQESDWQRAIERCQAFGPLNVLVNNAAVVLMASIVDTTNDDYRRVFEINQFGTFLGIRSAVAPMKAAGGGSIINVSSIDGLHSSAGLSAFREGVTAGQVAVSTDAAGLARAFLRLGTRVGAYSVAARALGGPSGGPVLLEATFAATAEAADPDRLVIIAGDGQTAVVDTLHAPGSPDFEGRDPNPFVVQAVDAFDQPVPGVAVQWLISDGGGALLAATTVTDAAGLSQNRLVGVTEGRNAVVAVAAGTEPVEFEVTGVLPEPDEE